MAFIDATNTVTFAYNAVMALNEMHDDQLGRSLDPLHYRMQKHGMEGVLNFPTNPREYHDWTGIMADDPGHFAGNVSDARNSMNRIAGRAERIIATADRLKITRETPYPAGLLVAQAERLKALIGSAEERVAAFQDFELRAEEILTAKEAEEARERGEEPNDYSRRLRGFGVGQRYWLGRIWARDDQQYVADSRASGMSREGFKFLEEHPEYITLADGFEHAFKALRSQARMMAHAAALALTALGVQEEIPPLDVQMQVGALYATLMSALPETSV